MLWKLTYLELNKIHTYHAKILTIDSIWYRWYGCLETKSTE